MNEDNMIGRVFRYILEEGAVVFDDGAHRVCMDGSGNRAVESMDGSFHMLFIHGTGFTAKWGRSYDEDPSYCPFGNEIADIEITTSCRGIRDREGNRAPCAFCLPAGTLVSMDDGSSKPIECIRRGDEVASCRFAKDRPDRLQRNVVQETYERQFDGELIVLELEDGTVLRLTPEHPLILKDGTEIMAKDLTGEEDLVLESCLCNGLDR